MMIDKIHSGMVQLFHQYILGRLPPDAFSTEFSRYESRLYPAFLSERLASVQLYGQLMLLTRLAKETSASPMASLKASLTRLNHHQKAASRDLSGHGTKELFSGDKHAMQNFFSNAENVESVREAYRLKHIPDSLSRPLFDAALTHLDEVFNVRTEVARQHGFSSYSHGKCALISDTQTESVLKTLGDSYAQLSLCIDGILADLSLSSEGLRDPATFRIRIRQLLADADLTLPAFSIDDALNSFVCFLNERSDAAASFRRVQGGYLIDIRSNSEFYRLPLLSCPGNHTVTAPSNDIIAEGSTGVTYLKARLFTELLSVREIRTLYHELGHLLSMSLYQGRPAFYHADFRDIIEVPSQLIEYEAIAFLYGSYITSRSQRKLFDCLIRMDIPDELRQTEIGCADILVHSGTRCRSVLNAALPSSVHCYFSYPYFPSRLLYVKHIQDGDMAGEYYLYPLNAVTARAMSQRTGSLLKIENLTDSDIIRSVQADLLS